MYPKTEKPTLYFIGVTTGQSSIMGVFPEWAAFLRLGDCAIQGIDLKQHAEPDSYRRVFEHIKNNVLSLGAVVTTHKIDLLKACADSFDELDSYAQLMSEVSCISKRDHQIIGHALDPITSGLTLEAFLPRNHWSETGAEAFVLGAGGSSIAATFYMMRKDHGANRPSKITVSNRSAPRLKEMEKIHHKIDEDINVEYVHAPKPEDNDRIIGQLRPHSMIVNATGLGKDAPGSPLTDAAVFPEYSIVWDFNYRGDLVFLDQARTEQKQKNIQIEDGWVYFIHGWLQALSRVFHIGSGVRLSLNIAD